MALLLTLNRKIHRAFNRVRKLNFSPNGLVGFDLYAKTAGIVGTGKIGRVTAEILRGFGMRVQAYDPFPNHEWPEQSGVDYADAPSALIKKEFLLHILDDHFSTPEAEGQFETLVDGGSSADLFEHDADEERLYGGRERGAPRPGVSSQMTGRRKNP